MKDYIGWISNYKFITRASNSIDAKKDIARQFIRNGYTLRNEENTVDNIARYVVLMKG